MSEGGPLASDHTTTCAGTLSGSGITAAAATTTAITTTTTASAGGLLGLKQFDDVVAQMLRASCLPATTTSTATSLSSTTPPPPDHRDSGDDEAEDDSSEDHDHSEDDTLVYVASRKDRGDSAATAPLRAGATDAAKYVRSADDKNPHRCHYPSCTRAFGRLEHLKRHIRAHTGERPFGCVYPNCHKRFSRYDNMLQHARCHTNKSSRQRKRSVDQAKNGMINSTGTSAAAAISAAANGSGLVRRSTSPASAAMTELTSTTSSSQQLQPQPPQSQLMQSPLQQLSRQDGFLVPHHLHHNHTAEQPPHPMAATTYQLLPHPSQHLVHHAQLAPQYYMGTNGGGPHAQQLPSSFVLGYPTKTATTAGSYQSTPAATAFPMMPTSHVLAFLSSNTAYQPVPLHPGMPKVLPLPAPCSSDVNNPFPTTTREMIATAPSTDSNISVSSSSSISGINGDINGVSSDPSLSSGGPALAVTPSWSNSELFHLPPPHLVLPQPQPSAALPKVTLPLPPTATYYTMFGAPAGTGASVASTVPTTPNMLSPLMGPGPGAQASTLLPPPLMSPRSGPVGSTTTAAPVDLYYLNKFRGSFAPEPILTKP